MFSSEVCLRKMPTHWPLDSSSYRTGESKNVQERSATKRSTTSGGLQQFNFAGNISIERGLTETSRRPAYREGDERPSSPHRDPTTAHRQWGDQRLRGDHKPTATSL